MLFYFKSFLIFLICNNLMRYNFKLFILLCLILVTIVTLLLTNLSRNESEYKLRSETTLSETLEVNNVSKYDVWCIFTKADERRNQIKKFGHMLLSMLGYSSVPLTLHLIVDDASRNIASDTVEKAINFTGKDILIKFYDVGRVTEHIDDIVNIMKPHFSPKAGSYYSDSLFYISLGLHRIAPKEMSRAILLDVDLQFEDDIASLFDEFKGFSESNLFGLAPELAPVYYHLLSAFRSRNAHRHLSVGTPCCSQLHTSSTLPRNLTNMKNKTAERKAIDEPANNLVTDTSSFITGHPGLNSGVVLLHLDRIRTSLLFQTVTTEDFVSSLTEKYLFKGHLGDQDFYSLLSWEVPSIVHTIDCGWNRQLCTWWRDHGYPLIHSTFSYCPNKTRLYHANCNSNFPQPSVKT